MMERWTKDEIEIAWSLRRLGGTSISRNVDSMLIPVGKDMLNDYFQSIEIGESVNLDDIINSTGESK